MTTLGQWAADSERAGFSAVGVIDRLVYDNLDPLAALAAAAATTKRIELRTTVLSVGWRSDPGLLVGLFVLQEGAAATKEGVD